MTPTASGWPPLPPIAVAVPARDERQRLPRLLHALARQTGATRDRITVCLLFDGADAAATAAVAALAPDLPYRLTVATIERTDAPNAGRARAAAMTLAARALGPRPGLLTTTDADSAPAEDWLARSAAALAEVDLVAGHIVRRDPERQAGRCRVERYRERLHALRRAIDPLDHDPAPSHPSLGGASLGLRADAYRALGGFARLASAEDVDLVRRAREAGLLVRHDRSVRVVTSARTRGRAPGGLAAELAEIEQHGAGWRPSVEDPRSACLHYRRQAAARRAFDGGRSALGRLAEELRLPPCLVAGVALRSRNATAFVARLLPEPVRPPRVPLPAGEGLLAEIEAGRRERVA